MSSALANESGTPKRKRLDISSVSRQQRWSRKQQLHTNITQAMSSLEEEGVHPSCITLVYNGTGENTFQTILSYSNQFFLAKQGILWQKLP